MKELRSVSEKCRDILQGLKKVAEFLVGLTREIVWVLVKVLVILVVCTFEVFKVIFNFDKMKKRYYLYKAAGTTRKPKKTRKKKEVWDGKHNKRRDI